ncbi:DUF29 domain-containing protein [Rhodopila sp.]|uniref:DUF29 domain-containing protein n=1 Tax=Rhodopila sp. TaxID=2480087 RepID=UPI003D09F90E
MSAYDTDILVWSTRQAEMLRRRGAGEPVNDVELDWLNIAEEIESLGKSVARELASRISTILIHLMKLQASPAVAPRIGWLETIREQRDEIETLLKDAPSLRQTIPGVIGEKLAGARKRVHAALADHGEQALIELDAVSYTQDQVTGEWLP